MEGADTDNENDNGTDKEETDDVGYDAASGSE